MRPEPPLTGAAGVLPQGAAGPAAHERGAARRVPGAEVDVRRAAAPAGSRERPRRAGADPRRQPRYAAGGGGAGRAGPFPGQFPGGAPRARPEPAGPRARAAAAAARSAPGAAPRPGRRGKGPAGRSAEPGGRLCPGGPLRVSPGPAQPGGPLRVSPGPSPVCLNVRGFWGEVAAVLVLLFVASWLCSPRPQQKKSILICGIIQYYFVCIELKKS